MPSRGTARRPARGGRAARTLRRLWAALTRGRANRLLFSAGATVLWMPVAFRQLAAAGDAIGMAALGGGAGLDWDWDGNLTLPDPALAAASGAPDVKLALLTALTWLATGPLAAMRLRDMGRDPRLALSVLVPAATSAASPWLPAASTADLAAATILGIAGIWLSIARARPGRAGPARIRPVPSAVGSSHAGTPGGPRRPDARPRPAALRPADAAQRAPGGPRRPGPGGPPPGRGSRAPR